MRAQRRGRQWSQATLAEHLDVSVDYVSLLERGLRLPALGLLVAAARTFRVSVDAMVGEEIVEEWADEALRNLRGVPAVHRPTLLALLRGLSDEGES